MIRHKQYNRRSEPIILEDCYCERDCAWQINTVPPKRLLSNSPHYERLKREFRGFVDRPHLTLEHVGMGSGQKGNWECENCGNEWITAVAHRSDGQQCNVCASKEAGRKQAIRKATGNDHPFVDKAIRVIKYPEISPEDLPPKSNLACLWPCRCGATFEANFGHVEEYGMFCSKCNRGSSSRFEHNICDLLQAGLPQLTVTSHYRKEEYKKYIDIYVAELDLAIEIDTKYYHADTLATDERIYQKLRAHYKNVLRVRASTIPRMKGSLIVEDPNFKQDPAIWFAEIIQNDLLQPHANNLTDAEIHETLTTSNRKWDNGKGIPKVPATTISNIEQAFIQNLTRPGRQLEYTTNRSNDTAEFRCLEDNCDHVYPQRIYRWADGIRCPKHKADHIRRGRLTGKGSRLKNTHPEIFAEVMHVIDYPDFDISLLTTNSSLLCLFKCRTCAHEWPMAPGVRNAPSKSGCPACKKSQGIDRDVPIEKQFMVQYPEFASEYVRNLSVPNRPVERLSVTSSDLCEWNCSNSAHEPWLETPKNRSRIQKRQLCPLCYEESKSKKSG